MKACTNGPRHKWTWLKNTTSAQVSSRSASFSMRGLYRCACGARKAGEPNHNEPSSLNELVATLAGEAQP